MFLIILHKNTNIKVTRYQIKIWESSGLGLLRAKTHSEILIKPSHEMIKHGLYEKKFHLQTAVFRIIYSTNAKNDFIGISAFNQYRYLKVYSSF